MFTKAPLLALTLLAACATSPVAEEQLGPSEWRIITIDAATPVSPRASVEFLPDRISATAGCNGLGGSWSTMDGHLITGPFMSTMMFCDGLMEQERALAGLFESKPAFVLNGDRLVLEGGGHKVELRRLK
jgi:heat shock protein HslJ